MIPRARYARRGKKDQYAHRLDLIMFSGLSCFYERSFLELRLSNEFLGIICDCGRAFCGGLGFFCLGRIIKKASRRGIGCLSFSGAWDP